MTGYPHDHEPKYFYEVTYIRFVWGRECSVSLAGNYCIWRHDIDFGGNIKQTVSKLQ